MNAVAKIEAPQALAAQAADALSSIASLADHWGISAQQAAGVAGMLTSDFTNREAEARRTLEHYQRINRAIDAKAAKINAVFEKAERALAARRKVRGEVA